MSKHDLYVKVIDRLTELHQVKPLPKSEARPVSEARSTKRAEQARVHKVQPDGKAPSYLSEADVMKRTGLSKDEIWAGVRAASFPHPVKMGGDLRSKWHPWQIEDWEKSRRGAK